jgi:IS30 family transposase
VERRQYFPEGSDLRVHGPEVLAALAAKLNARPRKTPGWDTPHRPARPEPQRQPSTRRAGLR